MTEFDPSLETLQQTVEQTRRIAALSAAAVVLQNRDRIDQNSALTVLILAERFDEWLRGGKEDG